MLSGDLNSTYKLVKMADSGKETTYKRLKYTLYFCLFFGYSVYYYNRKSYTSLIPSLLQSLRLEESELGIISSSFGLSYGISKFVGGILSDKLQPRELFVAGLIGTGLCNAFFTTCRSIQMLAFVWFINGLVQGLSWPPCSKMLKEWFRPNEIGKFWSFLTVGCNITSGICPLATVYLTTRYSWQTAMIVPGSIALAIAPILYMSLYNSPHEAGLPDIKVEMSTGAKQPKTSWTKVVFQLLFSPFLWVLIHGYFLAALIRNAMSDWIQLYLIQYKKHSFSTAGMAMSSFEIGGMAGSILVGIITDRWMQKNDPAKKSSPRMPAFVWLFGIFVICIHLFRTEVGPTSSMFFIGILLFGCGLALSGSISIYGLVAMENGPPGFSGTSHAIVALGSSVGAVLAGYPLATLGKVYGWHQTFLLLQVLAVINFIVHLLTCGLNKEMVDTSKLQ